MPKDNLKKLKSKINQGKSKREAMNEMEGAGHTPERKRQRRRKGKTSFGPVQGGRGK